MGVKYVCKDRNLICIGITATEILIEKLSGVRAFKRINNGEKSFV